MKKRTIWAAAAVLILALLGACSGSESSPGKETKAAESAADAEDTEGDNEGGEEEAQTEEEGLSVDAHEYTIYYYDDIDAAEPSTQTTTAVYGTKTKILTIKELGFSKEGKVFEGWRMTRDVDSKWYLRNADGKLRWRALDNGELPEGFVWQLRKNGAYFTNPAIEGDVRIYAQWGGESFTVYYHEDEDSEAAGTYTVVPYGVKTEMIPISELGFEKDGKEFAGWKAYREIDNKWYAKNAEGKGKWVKLTDGELPEGYTWNLFVDQRQLSKAATSGIVHVYAQWE